MGIDALDLVFRLEDRLGITISRHEAIASCFSTAGDIHRYLVAKLRGESGQVPRIDLLILEVSRAVRRIAGRWRWLIPSSNLNTKFPPASRAANWLALETALGVSLPPLEHPADQEFPRIPRQYESAFTLAHWIAEHHPERIEWIPVSCERKGKMASHSWTEEEIWDILRECICDALGVKPEEVTPDARMVEDLGME